MQLSVILSVSLFPQAICQRISGAGERRRVGAMFPFAKWELLFVVLRSWFHTLTSPREHS